MSTINNNLRTNLVGNNKLGLRANFNNKNLANLQAGKNASLKPLKRTALTQSTNILKDNGKLGSKQSNVIIKKNNILSGVENDNSELKTKTNLCPKKSKIPKIVSPKVDTTKDLIKKNKVKVPSVESKILEKLKEENVIKFSSFKIPENVENIDSNDGINVLLAPGYTNDIYLYLSHLETKFKLKSNFLQIQQKMNFKMRARLVDWIIAVHHKFRLLPETLYLTVAIMDRYLEKVSIEKGDVQLVGLTAFFIACKYEEIYPPEINDFLKVCDAYKKNEIIKMEKKILKTLNFVLSYPLPLHFLRRFSKAAHADQQIHTLAKYFMELGLLEYECASWKPSLLAAASLYLTLHILNDDNDSNWTETLAFYTSYKEIDLQKHVSYLCKVLIKTKDSKLQTVKTKFSNDKLLRISKNEKLESEYVFNMATKDEN